MTYQERKEKEKHLLYLLKYKRLYSLEKIANDFGCSKRTIKRMLLNLRNEGKKIVYCRKSEKYFLQK